MKNVPTQADSFVQYPQAIRKRVNEIYKGKQVSEQRRIEVANQLMQQKEKMQRRKIVKPLHTMREELFTTFHSYARGGWVNSKELYKLLEKIVIKQQRLHLVMLWGGSMKNSLTLSDYEVFARMQQLINEICTIYKEGVIIDIIIADVHIANNGYGKLKEHEVFIFPETQAYIEQVGKQIRHLNAENKASGNTIKFRIKYLSALYKKKHMSYISKSASGTKAARETANKYKDFLLLNAQRYNKTGQTPWAAAVQYVSLRLREKQILATMPHAILLGSGVSIGAKDIILPPKMPGVFLGRRAPWFQKV